MLGNIVKSSSFAVVTFVGHPCLKVPIPLMSTISPFLYIRTYVAKGTAPCFLKDLENIQRVPLLSLCVGHFGKLLVEGGSV